jgi:Lipoprotein LpqB beta-propeller domain/Sporulation and spore germination
MGRRRPSRTRLGRAGLGAVVGSVGVVALTAACGGIPSSGKVHAGAQLDGPPAVRVLAAPPVPGASPAEIVRGFLRAQPGLDDDAAVARSYLVGDTARSWATRPRVVVYPDESSLRIVAGAGGAFTVTTAVDATVDRSGVYAEAPVGAKAVLKLKLSRVGGQWRISSLDDPQTRWLTSFDLDRVYDQVPLYYGVPGTRVLVPDMRWFAATSGLATVVARAQLEAPPAYLRSAVTTGIPAGTSLALGSVPTAGSVASIDLTLSARQPGSGDRTLLWAQLAASVAQAPGVVTVRVLVNGKLLELPGQSIAGGTTAGALGYSVDAAPSSSAVSLSSAGGHAVLTQLASGIGNTGSAVKATLPSFTTPLRSLARSSDGREFAGVEVSGRSLLRVVGGKTTLALSSPGGLTDPSYDARHWLWTASSGAGISTKVHAILTATGSKDVTDVTPAAPWLDGRRITALRISRDGARALVTSTGRGGWRVEVTGIQRDSHGKPITLTTPLRLGLGLTDIIDAAWVDATSVALLAHHGTDKGSQPYLVTIGAGTAALPDVTGAVAIAAGNGPDSVTITTAKGDVLGRGGSSGWVAIGHGVDVAFPG